MVLIVVPTAMAIITVAESVTNNLSHVLQQLAVPDLKVATSLDYSVLERAIADACSCSALLTLATSHHQPKG